MQKYIPFSLILMTFVVPMVLASRPGPKKQMRLTQGLMAGYIVLWAYMCLYVYTQYVFIE
jgi:hypothetical protein